MQKHTWEIHKKPATLLKVTLLHGCFSRFLTCTNGTKCRNASINYYIHDLLSDAYHIYNIFQANAFYLYHLNLIRKPEAEKGNIHLK